MSSSSPTSFVVATTRLLSPPPAAFVLDPADKALESFLKSSLLGPNPMDRSRTPGVPVGLKVSSPLLPHTILVPRAPGRRVPAP